MGNLYTLVQYFQEVVAASNHELVVVDRRNLRALVLLAKHSPRYSHSRAIARRLGLSDNKPKRAAG